MITYDQVSKEIPIKVIENKLSGIDILGIVPTHLSIDLKMMKWILL